MTKPVLDTPEYIEDMAAFLDHAYEKYQAFKRPSGRINVSVGDYTASELGTVSGVIKITTLLTADPVNSHIV